MYKRVFFFSGIQNLSVPVVGLFSCSRLRGTQGARLYTVAAKCGSRPGSVERALGIQSSEIWRITTWSLSTELEPSKTVENPHIKM